MKYLALFLLSFNIFAMPAIDLSTVPASPPGATAQLWRDASLNPADKEIPVYDPNNIKLRFICKFAKGGVFDPLVYPGQPVAGHHHTFFGNVGVNPNSTGTSILNSGNSTCAGGTLFRSAMWVPSIVDKTTAKFIRPKEVIVYYTGAGSAVPRTSLTEMPAGLKMLAGFHTATPAAPNDVKIARWTCVQGNTSSPLTTYMPTCPVTANKDFIRLMVAFPSCWDGVNLDSTDHRSHMKYRKTGNYLSNPLKNECPTSHPKRIPEVALHVDYTINGVGLIHGNGYTSTANWALVSDNYDLNLNKGGQSAHADYILGIDGEVRKMMNENCHIPMNDCGIGNLGKNTNPAHAWYNHWIKLNMPTATELGE